MSNLKERAHNLRIRLFKMRITHGLTIKSLADEIGYHKEYTSAVLRGKYESEILCDKLEQVLDEIESSDKLVAAL